MLLSALNFTHEGKIDVIYIDPPYNTGARNWKYNNDFVEREDAYRHSKFINFLNKRFIFTRKLLSNKGIIICAIDDYEIHNVRHLMDSLFKRRKPIRNDYSSSSSKGEEMMTNILQQCMSICSFIQGTKIT